MSYKSDRIFHANFFALLSSDFELKCGRLIFKTTSLFFSVCFFLTEVTMTECKSYVNSLLEVDWVKTPSLADTITWRVTKVETQTIH